MKTLCVIVMLCCLALAACENESEFMPPTDADLIEMSIRQTVRLEEQSRQKPECAEIKKRMDAVVPDIKCPFCEKPFYPNGIPPVLYAYTPCPHCGEIVDYHYIAAPAPTGQEKWNALKYQWLECLRE